MRSVDKKYQAIPFWSWNTELKEKDLIKQIRWMNSQGIGGFFMHARGGLTTPYLGKQWFKCVKASAKEAKKLGMYAYAYDENGWPSGFAGGKLLENIENHDMYIVHAVGGYDSHADVSYDLSGDKLVRTNHGNNCLNIYLKHSTSTADILNPEVVDQFIRLTHEEYLKRDKYGIKGFFTDEPQYYRWGTPYTKVLSAYFKNKYNEDILDGIGLLFVEKDGYQEFRYKYWKAMQDLMLNNFAKKIYDWCDAHNYQLTGHYVEETSLGAQMWCCGGIMPFYEYEHIPGIDWLGRFIGNELSAKQVGSVAAQLGKKQVITETFGCSGWDVTPQELKHIGEHLYVNGVNLMCHHLLPLKENGQRKRDYPPHFSPINPWVEKNFKGFNDYFSVLGEILSNSKEICNVAVLHPIRSTYFNYKRDCPQPDNNVLDIENGLCHVMDTLNKKGIAHHFIDETLLAKYGRVENGKLIMGLCSYSFIILPLITTMDVTTETLLKEFVKQGGKVYLFYDKPQYLEWKKYDYAYLKTNVALEEIIAEQEYSYDETSEFALTYRVADNNRPFIYAVNLGEERDIEIKCKNYKSFDQYDIYQDIYHTIDRKLHFKKHESKILYLSNKEVEKEKEKSIVGLPSSFEVIDVDNNYLTLDFIRYSIDGINYSKPLHHMGIFDELLKKKYSGKVYLKYDFNIKEIPETCFVRIEKENIDKVLINDVEIKKKHLTADNELLEYDIAKELKKGSNTITAILDYYQDPYVYYVLFESGDTESLKNCLVYNSTIEAIYLCGSFGVYGDFKKGQKDNVIIGENFYLDKPKTTVQSLIEDGYPFVSGSIHLRGVINCSNKDSILHIDKRFHLLDVSINNSPYQRMMLDNDLDISSYVKEGENVIDIIVTTSRRNQLGPFHTPIEEDLAASPMSFERSGTWKDGESSELVKSYAFVKTII